MDEKVAVQEVWKNEAASVMAKVCEKWGFLWEDAHSLYLSEDEGKNPEILAREWARRWGICTVHAFVFAEGERAEEEKREKYLLAQAAKHVYAIRYLGSRSVLLYHDYIWWCEKLFPLTRLYCEHTGRFRKVEVV